MPGVAAIPSSTSLQAGPGIQASATVSSRVGAVPDAGDTGLLSGRAGGSGREGGAGLLLEGSGVRMGAGNGDDDDGNSSAAPPRIGVEVSAGPPSEIGVGAAGVA